MTLRRLEQFDFHHVIEATPGPALVVFTAPACGACRQVKAVLAAEGERFADLALFEVDAGTDLALTREFEVFHLPALFLFHDGEYHGPVHAEPLAGPLRAAIDAVLAAPPQEAP